MGIKDRFKQSILQQAMALYSISPDNINLLNSYDYFMYEFTKDGNDYILRLGHSRHQSPELIRGEVDWINYLADGGAGVARAVPSEQGSLVEVIPDNQGGQFLATAFVRARGAPVQEMGGWTDALLQEYGRLLGRMHMLSKAYQLPDPAWHRGHWYDPRYLGPEDVLPPTETMFPERYLELMQHLTRFEEHGSMVSNPR